MDEKNVLSFLFLQIYSLKCQSGKCFIFYADDSKKIVQLGKTI